MRMGAIANALAEHAFERLFIECLGWDRFRTTLTVDHAGFSMPLTGIAEKRGFAVFVAPAHRTILANRRLLRTVQRQVRRSHHEHILIHVCETPRKQVWQWATTTADGRRIRHREHPFFSNEPPARLLERIQGMSISFAEEEQTGLTDVLARVRAALAPDSELNLFAKHPSYAAESDRLAMAMKRGEPGAYSRFVEFHMPLARHSSRMLIRWFGMDPDDAEQTAMIGLMEAARRFDPDRGYQFSTYAGHWLRQVCQRYGLQWGMPIRVPPHIFWPCYRLLFRRDRLASVYGHRDAEEHFERELEQAGVTRAQWTLFCRSRQMELLCDLESEPGVGLESAGESTVVDEAASDELCDAVSRALQRLIPRHAEILRLRYGLGGREHTLEEVADKLGVTRERVRQIQVKAEEALQRQLAGKALFDDGMVADEPTAEVTTEESTA
jgi:RNA polymerase sigma factor (sigma-70 family)